MAYNTKTIITDSNKKPVPQYYNPETDQYEPNEGRNGANAFIEKGRIVKEVWSGSSDIAKSFNTEMFGLAIVNDGDSEVSVTINNMSFVIKPGESFDDLFEPFTSLTIITESEYRAIVRE